MKLLVTVVLLVALAGCGHGETAEHKAARTDAKTQAEYYCTMTPAGNDANYIYTDQYLNCVKAQTKVFLGQWEAENPGK